MPAVEVELVTAEEHPKLGRVGWHRRAQHDGEQARSAHTVSAWPLRDMPSGGGGWVRAGRSSIRAEAGTTGELCTDDGERSDHRAAGQPFHQRRQTRGTGQFLLAVHAIHESTPAKGRRRL